MPRRSTAYGSPRHWLVEGDWPDGEFAQDAPEVVAYAVEVSRRLSAALDGVNRSTTALEAGVDRKTLYGLVAGTTWADMITIAKLETALNVSLWPQLPPKLRRR